MLSDGGNINGAPFKIFVVIYDIHSLRNNNISIYKLYFLLLSLPNPLKPGVKLRTKMQVEQRRQAMPQLHLSDQQLYFLLSRALY